jgi:hypothetical protein
VEGNNIPLAQLWRGRRIVLVFLRHFGCIFCHKLMKSIVEVYPKFQQADVSVVCISIGSPATAKHFQAKWGFKGEIYVDQSPKEAFIYKLFGLPSSPFNLRPAPGSGVEAAGSHGFRKDVYKAWMRAQEVDHLDASLDIRSEELDFQADMRQIGGTFVLGPGNTCDFAFRETYAGHLPPLQRVIAAATGKEEEQDYIYPSTKVSTRY